MNIAEQQQIHVSSLHDSDIDALVDRHVFGHSAWCHGYCELSIERHGYYCQLCGAIEERGAAALVFGSDGHPRNVPQYSIEQVIEAMRRQSHAIQISFALSVREAFDDNHLLRGSIVEFQRLLFGLSPRLVAIAALQALGVVDLDGNVVQRKAVHCVA